MDELQKQVGARIRELRKAKGLSQEDLAEMIDSSNSYVGHVERGERNVTLHTLDKIAQALKVEVKELLAYQGMPIDQRLLVVLKILEGKSDKDIRRATIVLEQLFE